MVNHSIVLAGFESLLPLIIVIVVIVRIVNAIKKVSSGAGGPAKPSGGKGLEQDLERFFQNLAGQEQNAAEEEAAPPPVPLEAKQEPARQARTETSRPIQQARPVAPKPLPEWGSRGYGLDVSSTQKATSSYGPSTARRQIVSMIKDEKSIRKAILLREVLGPPVALRNQEQLHA